MNEISSVHGNITHEGQFCVSHSRHSRIVRVTSLEVIWKNRDEDDDNEMYSMDGYRAYTDQLVLAIFERWPDPDTNFTVNDSSFYPNEIERNNCNNNENIYKLNDSNEKKTKHLKQQQQHIGYGIPTMFIPYFGALQQSPTSPITWHQHQGSPTHRTYLSTDAMPFIPTKCGHRKYFSFFILILSEFCDSFSQLNSNLCERKVESSCLSFKYSVPKWQFIKSIYFRRK